MISIKDRKKLQKFIRQIDDRRINFEKHILKAMAEETLKQVKGRAPIEPDLGTYANHLQAAEVMSNNPTAAVLYTGPTLINADRIDGGTNVIFIRGVRKENDRNQAIYQALILYQPYTIKTFPSNIKAKDFILTYQKVPTKKVYETIDANKNALSEMRKSFKPFGIKLDDGQYQDPKKLEVFPDLTFQVLQHELKTKKKAKPHWRPALKAVQNRTFLKKLMAEDDSVRILADPNFNDFKVSGKMGLKVSAQSVQSTAEFMEYLQPNNSKE